MRQTLFTPTYNRHDTLCRLYDSIKKQSFKDFIWLIIDDGSTDNTKDLVQSFVSDDIIAIKYVYKENGGKHTAMKMALDMAETPYITFIDSDDELLPNTMEEFEKEWSRIEETGGGKIAIVQMFCKSVDGKRWGNGSFTLRDDVDYIDASWQELVLDRKCDKEFISSRDVTKVKECFDFDKYTWHQETNKFLAEYIIWANVGRKYLSRLINKDGRIYHTDASNSILRQKTTIEKKLNMMTNYLYFLNENMDCFWRRPKYFMGMIVSFIMLGRQANTSIKEQWLHLKGGLFAFLYIVLLLPCVIANKCGIERY